MSAAVQKPVIPRLLQAALVIAGIYAGFWLIFDLILATASGEPSKSEALGIGDDEFVPWTVGAIL